MSNTPKLTLTVNASEDPELRLYVKNLIYGQVQAILRESLREIAKESIIKQSEGIITSEVRQTLKELSSNSSYPLYGSSKETIKSIVRDYVKRDVSDAIAELVTSEMILDLIHKDFHLFLEKVLLSNTDPITTDKKAEK